MLQEITTQRALLGDRAANFAADNAQLRALVEALKARIAELEKLMPKEAGEQSKDKSGDGKKL